jgi:hypothetical protein
MNKKKILLGSSALVLGGVLMFPALTQAYRGDPSVQGPNYTPERHDAMTQAFENNDYNAWKELMSDRGRVTQVVTEENFSRFAEAHELAEEGKFDEARQIRQELGLGLRDGSGHGQHKGGGMHGMGGGWNR